MVFTASGTGTGPQIDRTSFISLVNPSFLPMEVTSLDLSDSQFSTDVNFPLTLEPLGSRQAIRIRFRPDHVGVTQATAVIRSADPTPVTIELTGEGMPNDAPVLGACSLTPSPAILGQILTFTVEADDTAEIQAKSQALAAASMKLGEAMYQAAQEDTEHEVTGEHGDDASGAEAGAEDVVDADFEEIPDDEADSATGAGEPGEDQKKSA